MSVAIHKTCFTGENRLDNWLTPWSLWKVRQVTFNWISDGSEHTIILIWILIKYLAFLSKVQVIKFGSGLKISCKVEVKCTVSLWNKVVQVTIHLYKKKQQRDLFRTKETAMIIQAARLIETLNNITKFVISFIWSFQDQQCSRRVWYNYHEFKLIVLTKCWNVSTTRPSTSKPCFSSPCTCCTPDLLIISRHPQGHSHSWAFLSTWCGSHSRIHPWACPSQTDTRPWMTPALHSVSTS